MVRLSSLYCLLVSSCICIAQAEESRAEHSLVDHSLVDHSLAEHSLAEHSIAEHSIAEHSIAEHSLAEQLQIRLSQIKTMQAGFQQWTVDARNTAIQNSDGYLWLASGAKFRIETKLPFEQTLVSNGAHFWTYDVDLEQVVVGPLSKDIKQVPILLFGNADSELLENYVVSSFEEEGQVNFVLQPKASDSLFEVLTMAFSETLPVNIRIRDSLGQNTRIEFTDPTLNSAISVDKFEFIVPAGVDLIDDR